MQFQPGWTTNLDSNGDPIEGKSEGELSPGDRLRIETPGGGGYGAPDG